MLIKDAKEEKYLFDLLTLFCCDPDTSSVELNIFYNK